MTAPPPPGQPGWEAQPGQPGWGARPDQPPPPPQSQQDERTWALASHIGCIVGAWVALAFLVPLVVLLIKGKESAFIRHHAVESLNFQLSMLIYGFVGFLLIFVGIGIFILPVLGVLWLVFVVIATLKASNGQGYRYPLTIRFVK
jgi:uncharacterized protein